MHLFFWYLAAWSLRSASMSFQLYCLERETLQHREEKKQCVVCVKGKDQVEGILIQSKSWLPASLRQRKSWRFDVESD